MGSDKVTHIYACQVATSNSVKQHKLRKMIAWLSEKEGAGKEFISLYIPANASFEQIVTTLKNQPNSKVNANEKVQNRFDESKKNVIKHLKLKKTIPENGLALFAGTFSLNEKNEVSNLEEIVPPESIATYLYQVDNRFHLEPLREMLRTPRVVGIIVMDSKKASFGLINGESLEFIEDITSGIPGKSGKGGQSQRRYERERDMELTYFFHRVAEHASKAFLESHKVFALIVGGPGNTKDDFLKGDYLHYELKNRLLDTMGIQSADKNGVREVLEKSFGFLKNMCAPEERVIVHRFLAELAKQNGLATYGLDSVLEALKAGAAEVAIVIDNTELVEIAIICRKCGLSKTMIVDSKKKIQTIQEVISRSCERCNSSDYETKEKDVVDILEDAASQTDAKVEVISTSSEEKAKLTSLGGFAALLRFRLK